MQGEALSKRQDHPQHIFRVKVIWNVSARKVPSLYHFRLYMYIFSILLTLII